MSLRSFCLLAALLPASAFASDIADGGACRNGAFPSQQSRFALARVVDAPRLYLLGDMEGCPAKGEPACRQRSYVVNGDTVVTGRDLGRYRCAFFPNKVGGSAGWVDRSKLQPLPVAVPTLQDWTGHWKDGDNGLRITVQGATARGWRRLLALRQPHAGTAPVWAEPGPGGSACHTAGCRCRVRRGYVPGACALAG